MPNKNNDLDPIAEFIIASESNLETAKAVFENYTKARDLILQQFFEKLRKRLLVENAGWWSDYSPPFFEHRYGAFKIAKSSWQQKYEIRIEAYNSGERMIGGVWRHAKLLGETPYIAGLAEAFAAESQYPKRTAWYEAQFEIHSPASDWRDPTSLWRIHTDTQFLSEVGALFQNWIEIAESFLDMACRQET